MPLITISENPLVRLNVEIIPNVLPESTMFIHGNLASNQWWQPCLNVWKKRAANQNWTGAMLLAEFRGCGASTPPTSVDDVRMNALSADFLELTEMLYQGYEGFKLNRPLHLVGHSTGGLIAAYMAAKKPHHFDRLVLLDPVGARGVTFESSMLDAFQAMKADKALTAQVIGSTIRNNDPENELFKNNLVADAFHAVQTTGPWILQALDGLDSRKLFVGFKNYSLVLHGEHDVLLPVQDSKELAALMKAEFEILADCGHCANIERPETLVDRVHAFLFAR